MEWCLKIQSTDYLQNASQSSTDNNEGDHGLILSQGSDPDGNEQQGPINDVTLVALRTGRRLQTAPIRIDHDDGEREFEQDTNQKEDKGSI
jgi:hypothetical protein